jgi:putative spermidine/putrescine transport system ATP-binding protein
LLRSLGITAVYVTHDQAEAMALGDRIVVMRNGAIAQIGTPREIYFEPASRFIAEFVGAANILEATAADGFLALRGGRLAIEGDGKNARGNVVAMVRPEAIALVAPEGASLTGRLETASFVGDRLRLTVAGVSERPLSIDAPNTVSARPGDRVGLSIDPNAIRLFPGERS